MHQQLSYILQVTLSSRGSGNRRNDIWKIIQPKTVGKGCHLTRPPFLEQILKMNNLQCLDTNTPTK